MRSLTNCRLFGRRIGRQCLLTPSAIVHNEANQVPATWIGAVEIRRSAAHGFDGPPHGGSSPFSGRYCKRLPRALSPFERLDRAPQRTTGDQQLALGFVNGDDDVL